MKLFCKKIQQKERIKKQLFVRKFNKKKELK